MALYVCCHKVPDTFTDLGEIWVDYVVEFSQTIAPSIKELAFASSVAFEFDSTVNNMNVDLLPNAILATTLGGYPFARYVTASASPFEQGGIIFSQSMWCFIRVHINGDIGAVSDILVIPSSNSSYKFEEHAYQAGVTDAFGFVYMYINSGDQLAFSVESTNTATEELAVEVAFWPYVESLSNQPPYAASLMSKNTNKFGPLKSGESLAERLSNFKITKSLKPPKEKEELVEKPRRPKSVEFETKLKKDFKESDTHEALKNMQYTDDEIVEHEDYFIKDAIKLREKMRKLRTVTNNQIKETD